MKTVIKTQLKKTLIIALLLAVSTIVLCQDNDTMKFSNSPETVIDTNSQKTIDSSDVVSRKSPLLYNRFIGIVLDETAFAIPLTYFFTKGYWEPQNNSLIYMCIYPVGFVFIEKFVKNMFVHPTNFALQESY